MSGIGAAVHRTALREEMLRSIAEGSRTLREENEHMEEILSEEHRMLSNEDVCGILNAQFVGVTQSALLASRKSPVRLPCRQHKILLSGTKTLSVFQGNGPETCSAEEGEGKRHMMPSSAVVEMAAAKQADHRRSAVATVRGLQPAASTVAANLPVHVGTGSVNYRVILEQQQEMHAKMERDASGYQDLVREALRNQRRIGEGIVDRTPEKKRKSYDHR